MVHPNKDNDPWWWQNINRKRIYLTPKNNKSGYKGVYWSKERKKWCAQITINNKTKGLGRYDTIEEAIEARKKAAKEYYGEFANED